MVLYVRKVLAELLPGRRAHITPVLYGGSVEPANIRALAAEGQVDGFLVGHASVEASTFSALIKNLS
jgi:triosephosphate isomerase